MSDRRILVTSALPYANGHIHLGIWWSICRPISGSVSETSRASMRLRLRRRHARTAIMIRAQQEEIREEELIATMREAHMADFAASTSNSTTTAARTARKSGDLP